MYIDIVSPLARSLSHYFSTLLFDTCIVLRNRKQVLQIYSVTRERSWLTSVSVPANFLVTRIFPILLRLSQPVPFGVFFVLIPFPKSDLAESSESITRDWTVQPWPINSAKSEHSLFPIYTVYFFFSVLEGRDTKGRKNGIKCGDRDCVWESREYDLLRLLACSCFFA